jgi:hypothetical protein
MLYYNINLSSQVKAKAGQKNKNVDKLQPESPLSRESKTAPAMKKRHMLPVSFNPV